MVFPSKFFIILLRIISLVKPNLWPVEKSTQTLWRKQCEIHYQFGGSIRKSFHIFKTYHQLLQEFDL